MLAARAALLTLLFAAFGCAAPPPPAAPVAPPKPADNKPSPRSVTLANPGGDAPDPELAALTMLEREAMGKMRDLRATLILSLPDARHWRRVKLWGYPTRTAFRFGDEHHAVAAVWYEPAKGNDDPESCLDRFIKEGRPAADAFGVRAEELRKVRTLQQDGLSTRPMIIDVIDASYPPEGKEMVGAIASYSSWPGTCLIQGFVVITAKHPDVARRIRDRWVTEAAPQIAWLPRVTAAPPFDSR